MMVGVRYVGRAWAASLISKATLGICPREAEAFVGGQTQLRSVIVKYDGNYI